MDRTLDIAQVSHLYRPSIGGIENYIYRLNQFARAAGHEVTTYTTDRSLANDNPVDTGERVHYCATEFSVLRNPVSRELHRRLRESDHDVYHLHNPWFLPTLEAAHAIDAPIVQTVHSAQITNNSPLVRALNVGYRPLARYIFARTDHNFTQGETERARLLDTFDLPAEQVSVLPNGIHPEEYEVPEEAVATVREEHGLDPDVPTVLFVSRLIPEKNPAVFVEAIAEHLEGRALQALVVGDGDAELMRSLRQAADDRVRFVATLPFEQLKAAYHAADLFVFLGTWEGLPTVILEAMNARMPVISTPVGAIPDAVTDGENGILVDSPPDARAVATAIRYYLDLPEERRAVGERNRERVREAYRWDDIADRILETYNHVLA